jgi:hypothetical protein
VALELVDDRHRASLRGAGNRSAGKKRGKHFHQRDIRSLNRRHRRRHLQHSAETLHRKQVGDLDRSSLSDFSQVASQQIDDHHVLGAILGRSPQFLRSPAVFREPPSARQSAFHRPCCKRGSATLYEQLR